LGKIQFLVSFDKIRNWYKRAYDHNFYTLIHILSFEYTCLKSDMYIYNLSRTGTSETILLRTTKSYFNMFNILQYMKYLDTLLIKKLIVVKWCKIITWYDMDASLFSDEYLQLYFFIIFTLKGKLEWCTYRCSLSLSRL